MDYPKFLSWLNLWKKEAGNLVQKEMIDNTLKVSDGRLLQVQRTKQRSMVEFAGPVHGYQKIVKRKWIPPAWLSKEQFEDLTVKANNGNEEAIKILVEMRPFGSYVEEVVQDWKHNLLTNGGRDFFHNQCYTNTAAGTRGSGFVVLSESAVAPAVTDTVVAGEITINGLARADATTKTHTVGTNSTTIEHTFTATAAFTAVQKSGLLNASSAGTLSHENTFTSTALATNDQLKVTWTLTLG